MMNDIFKSFWSVGGISFDTTLIFAFTVPEEQSWKVELLLFKLCWYQFERLKS